MIPYLTETIEIAGIIAFTSSGVFSGMTKRLDIFGVLVVGFVTAIGGGTIRDILIGETPVGWMRNISTPLIILITGVITMYFYKYIKSLKVALFLLDALGLGLFTIIGIQRGLDVGLSPGICLLLGTISGCFGGVIRDMLLNEIPVLFRREIYATACIAGGLIYLATKDLIGENFSELLSIVFICALRIVSFQQKWGLPFLRKRMG